MNTQQIEDLTNQFEKTKYAMYLRKSRADLELEAMGEEETLARHKRILYTLAAKHDIHPDQIEVYHELVSGDSIDERPEMQRLLSDVYRKKFKGVFVVEVERLARGNTRDQGEVADAFLYSKTLILTPAKVYDSQNESDQEYFEFGLFMSRREYKTITRRLKTGKASSVEEGNYILPQRVFGYNIVRVSKRDRYLVPNPEEVPILHMIFDWFTEDGQTPDWIAKKLTLMGIPTTHNKPEWHRNTIRDMLVNPHYIGKVTWNATQTVKVLDEETGKLVKKAVQTGEQKIYEGKHTGLISVEQFEKAREIVNSYAKPPVHVDRTLKNPLAGLLRCCDCGARMEYLSREGCPSSRYNTAPRFQHTRKIKCKKKSLAVSLVLDSLVEALKAYIEDYQDKQKNGNDQSELVRHNEMIKAMETELKKQEAKKRRLFDSWEADDGTYTRDEFIERKQMYAATIDNLKAKIQAEKKAAPAPVDYEERIVTLHSMIDCIKNPELSAKDKNDFLKKYIEKIDYDVIDYGVNKGGKPVLDVYLK